MRTTGGTPLGYFASGKWRGGVVVIDEAHLDIQSLASVKAVVRAAATDQRAEVRADPYFLLTDDEEIQSHLGGEVAYKTTVTSHSSSGPVQQQAGERLSVGSLVRCKVRELSDDRARIRIELERSTVDGYRDDVPQRSVDRSNHIVDVTSGGSYLIAHHRETSRRETRGTWLMLGQRLSLEQTVVQVWCSVYRVAIGVAPVSPRMADEIPTTTSQQSGESFVSPAVVPGQPLRCAFATPRQIPLSRNPKQNLNAKGNITDIIGRWVWFLCGRFLWGFVALSLRLERCGPLR